jgi:hypothetical protein
MEESSLKNMFNSHGSNDINFNNNSNLENKSIKKKLKLIPKSNSMRYLNKFQRNAKIKKDMFNTRVSFSKLIPEQKKYNTHINREENFEQEKDRDDNDEQKSNLKININSFNDFKQRNKNSRKRNLKSRTLSQATSYDKINITKYINKHFSKQMDQQQIKLYQIPKNNFNKFNHHITNYNNMEKKKHFRNYSTINISTNNYEHKFKLKEKNSNIDFRKQSEFNIHRKHSNKSRNIKRSFNAIDTDNINKKKVQCLKNNRKLTVNNPNYVNISNNSHPISFNFFNFNYKPKANNNDIVNVNFFIKKNMNILKGKNNVIKNYYKYK